MMKTHRGRVSLQGLPDSVVEVDAADRLAAYTSMHDLIVVATPIPEPPV
jgi:hypothetical protein